jgi:hypothetical protein
VYPFGRFILRLCVGWIPAIATFICASLTAVLLLPLPLLPLLLLLLLLLLCHSSG